MWLIHFNAQNLEDHFRTIQIGTLPIKMRCKVNVMVQLLLIESMFIVVLNQNLENIEMMNLRESKYCQNVEIVSADFTNNPVTLQLEV